MKTAIRLMVKQLDITISKLEDMISNNNNRSNMPELMKLLEGKKKVRKSIISGESLL